MQTALTFLIIAASLLYLCLKWMPASVRRYLHEKLQRQHPKLAASFEQAATTCASSCSSSCNSCKIDAAPQNKNTTKPVIFLRKL